MPTDAKTDVPAGSFAAGDKFPFGDVSADGWDTITGAKLLKAAADVSDDAPGVLSVLGGRPGGWAPGQPSRGLVVVHVGDSNTDNAAGRPGYQQAVDRELLSAGGVLDGATSVNLGQNGIELNGWVGTIATGNSSTPTTTRGNAWACVNNDPDIIVVRLGPNDVNTAAKRASGIGTMANLRANFATLVNFFLNNSRALVVVRVPQLSWYGGVNIATGVPGWADAADSRAAQDRLRTMCLEWQGRNGRVLVLDLKRYYGTEYCDDPAVDRLDPVTGGATMADSLHESDLGFRREVEGIARLLAPGREYAFPRASRTVLQESEEATKDAYWSIRVPVSGRSGNVLNVELNPQFLFSGSRHDVNPNQSRTSPAVRLRETEMLRGCATGAILWSLRNLPTVTGGYGFVFWNSGNVYTCDGFTFNQVVALTAPDPDYAQFTPSNITPALDAGDTSGPVTIFARSQFGIPWGPYSSRVISDAVLTVPGGQTQASFPLYGSDVTLLAVQRVRVCRAASTGAVTVELRWCNQADGRYVNASDPSSPYAAGKTFARATLNSGIFDGTATLDPDGLFATFPGGTVPLLGSGSNNIIRAFVTSGTVSGDLTAVVYWR